MIRRLSSSASRGIALVLVAGLIGAGCAIIPYPVPTDVERIDDVRLADDVLVSAGPRRLLERLEDRLEESRPELSVMEPIAFRDAAFPEGGWRLAELLETDRCRRVSEDLGIRFLVLIGGGVTQVRDEMGIMAPLMLPAGAMAARETSVLSAVIIDLERGVPACRLRSEGEGIAVAALWVIFSAFTVPLTGYSAERALARALAKALVEDADGGAVRVALMAAEASGDPFVAHEGAPITVGRDIEVGEMVNRLAEIEDDVAIGSTRREEIEERLGEPMFADPERRVDLYRFTAVAEGETRPFIAVHYFDWKTREDRPYTGYLLVVYEPDGTVVDLGYAVIAAVADPPRPQTDFQWGIRSTYDYAFPPTAAIEAGGFRAELAYREDRTAERVVREHDGARLFEKGEWLGP